MKILVYISGPITRGDRNANIAAFNRAHQLLMQMGYAVINPGLTGLLPWAWDVPHDDWIANDLPIVERVDMLVRLPGESSGADAEVAHAKANNVAVWFATLDELERAAANPTEERYLPDEWCYAY